MKNPKNVREIYKDTDGWWLAYAPGWKSSTDAVGACHMEHEDTKREVLALAKDAMPCDCAECRKILSGQ